MPHSLPPRFQYIHTSAIRDTKTAPGAASHTRHSPYLSPFAIQGQTFATDSSPFRTNSQFQPPELASRSTIQTTLPDPSLYASSTSSSPIFTSRSLSSNPPGPENRCQADTSPIRECQHRDIRRTCHCPYAPSKYSAPDVCTTS